MANDTLYTSLSATTIMAKLSNHVQRTKFITSTTDKHYSLDSADDFRSGCRNVSHQQQFFSELPSPRRSHYTNYWYSWVQTIYYINCLSHRAQRMVPETVRWEKYKCSSILHFVQKLWIFFRNNYFFFSKNGLKRADKKIGKCMRRTKYVAVF